MLEKIPGLGAIVGWIIGLYGEMLYPLATFVGERVFGVEATIEPTGSGDRTFNYLLLAVTASLAVVIAAGWTLASKGRRISPRVLDASRVVARYYLATTLLSYGWIKVSERALSAGRDLPRRVFRARRPARSRERTNTRSIADLDGVLRTQVLEDAVGNLKIRFPRFFLDRLSPRWTTTRTSS